MIVQTVFVPSRQYRQIWRMPTLTLMTMVGLGLALLGPGVIALLWTRSTRDGVSLRTSVPWLGAFVLLLAAVGLIAAYGEQLTASDVGFGAVSRWTVPFGLALAGFFIFIFGPAAVRCLARTGLGSFETGANALSRLPRWYLALVIVIVAAGEEWLYRGYAIERLGALTGHVWLAGALSLLAFGIVHLPLWGVGVALTTIVSGGIFTGLYILTKDIVFLMLAHVLTDLYGLVMAPRPLEKSSD